MYELSLVNLCIAPIYLLQCHVTQRTSWGHVFSHPGPFSLVWCSLNCLQMAVRVEYFRRKTPHVRHVTYTTTRFGLGSVFVYLWNGSSRKGDIAEGCTCVDWLLFCIPCVVIGLRDAASPGIQEEFTASCCRTVALFVAGLSSRWTLSTSRISLYRRQNDSVLV